MFFSIASIALSALSSSTSAADLTGQISFPYINQQQWQADMLAMHNNYRAQHGAGPVTWNSDLANYAENNAASSTWAHTVNGIYGENIATGTYTDPDTYGALWYNEQSLYNYNSPGFSEATGHFTQMVWAATTQIGCAMYNHAPGVNSAGYPYSLTCEYYPRGNVVGDNGAYFAQNVKPLVTSAAAMDKSVSVMGLAAVVAAASYYVL